LAIVGLSTLPFLHDIITEMSEGVRSFVPVIGIEKALTDSDGYVLGFSTYRVFLYTLFVHLGMHIAFVGWWFAAQGRRYRPILLLPVAMSLYQVLIIVSNSRDTKFNEPDTKLYILLGLCLLLGINFYYNNSYRKTQKLTKSKLVDHEIGQEQI
jgi:4-hydroxybenzoate polyprenyltransferase